MIGDMAAVADATGLERCALFGISQGCAFSIRYAVEHPERVTCLVLLGGFLRGRLKRKDPEQKKLYEALTMIIRDGWGSPNPVFRHFFTSNFIPDASPEIAASFDELQRIATSPENALRSWQMTVQLEAAELAKEVRVPTLVLHCKGDRVAPLEEGRDMARFIPGASFIELPGNNHALLALAGTPASTNSSRRRPTSSRCMTASCTALSPRGLLRVTSDGRGSRRRLLLLDPEAVVQGRTSILQEARLASPYPQSVASSILPPIVTGRPPAMSLGLCGGARCG
jgi:alpha/beta hydrolase fold